MSQIIKSELLAACIVSSRVPLPSEDLEKFTSSEGNSSGGCFIFLLSPLISPPSPSDFLPTKSLCMLKDAVCFALYSMGFLCQKLSNFCCKTGKKACRSELIAKELYFCF